MQQAPGPVELFGDQHPHQRMRQGQPRQGPKLLGATTTDRVQSIRPANQQAQIAALTQPAGQLRSQFKDGIFLVRIEVPA